MDRNFFACRTIILAAALVLCGCTKGDNKGTENSPAIGSEAAEDPAADETKTKQKIADNRVILEALIMEASDSPDNYAVRISSYGDFDGDGKNELFAVYGSEENNSTVVHLTSSSISAYGELWFADDEGAVMLYTKDSWYFGQPFIDLGDISILHADRYSDWQTFYFKMTNGRPERMDTFQLKDITYTGDRNFTGYALAHDGENDRTTLKPYWFYIPEDSDRLWEYRGEEITAEEFSKFEGSQQILDKISQEQGSEIIKILYRENGIININYKAWERGSLFRTLEISEDGSLNDITPLENQWWYIPAASDVMPLY